MKPTREQIQSLERDLQRIKNVEWCQVHLAPDGEIDSIDLTSDTQLAPNRIVRDVELLCRKHGISVDHKKVGVAQMDPEDKGGDTEAGTQAVPAVLEVLSEDPRPQLSAVHSSIRSGVFTAEVELTVGAFEGVPGRAEGPATDETGMATLVVQATLAAVRNLLAPGYELLLRDVQRVDSSGGSLVAVVVDFGQGRNTARLAGCSILEGSLHEAAVHATLDALNRQLGVARFREFALLEDEHPQGAPWHAASA